MERTSKVEAGCDEATGAGARPLRADAQRNRARILEAAENVFAVEGIEVPVDLIAEKAGVGVGTLYRHFPTKEKLCEAVLLDRLLGPDRRRPGVGGRRRPEGGVLRLPDPCRRGGRGRSVTSSSPSWAPDWSSSESSAAVKEGPATMPIGVLLQRAQAVGAVRPDVRPDAVLALVGATCQATAHSTAAPASICSPSCATGCACRPANRAAESPERLAHRQLDAPPWGDRQTCQPPSPGGRARTMAPYGSAGLCSDKPPSHSSTWPGHPVHGVQGDDRPGRCRRLAQAAQRRAPATPASQGEPSTVAEGPRPSIGVRVTPGATALTLMPSSPHSAAATWTSMERAALDAQ